MVQNHAVAEELAQEVFLRVYRSRASYEPTAKFSTWLFRIATHLALNAIRDGKHEKLKQSLGGDPDNDGAPRQFADDAPTVEEFLVRQARMADLAGAQAMPNEERIAGLRGPCDPPGAVRA